MQRVLLFLATNFAILIVLSIAKHLHGNAQDDQNGKVCG